MKKLTNQGFAAVEAFLIVVILAIIGGTGFYVYQANKKTGDTLNSAAKSAQSEPGKVKKKAQTTNNTYLTIKEIGIKIPVNDKLSGLEYEMAPSDDSIVLLSTSGFMQAVGECKSSDTMSASFPAMGVVSKFAGKYDSNAPPEDVYSQFTKQFSGFYISYSVPDGGPAGFCDRGPDKAKNDSVINLFHKIDPALKEAVRNAQAL